MREVKSRHYRIIALDTTDFPPGTKMPEDMLALLEEHYSVATQLCGVMPMADGYPYLIYEWK